MKDTYENIYGIRVVPNCTDDWECFGNFEGIVIYSEWNGIKIGNFVNQNNDYFAKYEITVPSKEIDAHSSSGKERAEFLLSKAKKLAKNNEEIAFSSNLVLSFKVLDKKVKS